MQAVAESSWDWTKVLMVEEVVGVDERVEDEAEEDEGRTVAGRAETMRRVCRLCSFRRHLEVTLLGWLMPPKGRK
jgi:hypothetical protein